MELNFAVAFIAGLVSFFAPCVIPLLPAYIGYVTGVSLTQLRDKGIKYYRKQIFISSVFYIIGFSLVFVGLGTTAAGFGIALRRYTDVIQTLGGLFIMVFALSFLGFIRFSFLEKEHRLELPHWAEKLGMLRALLIGMLFATAWTPCVGAVLGAILTLAATTSHLGEGALLLWVYSLGISIPFLIVSFSLAQAPIFLKSLSKYLPLVSKVAGLLLFLLGFLLFNNHLKLLSPLLTYDRLNGLLFQIASRFGLQAGLVEVLGW